VKTILGEQIIYDNFAMGAAKNEEDDSTIYLAFTDKDNEEVHMFKVGITKLDQYFNLVKQTAAGQKIEIVGADRMPKDGLHG
jgi:hypothetical protein